MSSVCIVQDFLPTVPLFCGSSAGHYIYSWPSGVQKVHIRQILWLVGWRKSVGKRLKLLVEIRCINNWNISFLFDLYVFLIIDKYELQWLHNKTSEPKYKKPSFYLVSTLLVEKNHFLKVLFYQGLILCWRSTLKYSFVSVSQEKTWNIASVAVSSSFSRTHVVATGSKCCFVSKHAV